MGIAVGGSKPGIMSEMNVVALIDVLLVLLVIFMIIPHGQMGLRAEIPQPAVPRVPPSKAEPDIIVIQILGGDRSRSTSSPSHGKRCAAGWKKSSKSGPAAPLSFAVKTPSSFRKWPK